MWPYHNPVPDDDVVIVPPPKPPYNAPLLVNTVNVIYCVSAHASRKRRGSLIDRGANGGVAGDDVRIINQSPHRKVDIQGLDNHQVNSVPIVTAGGVMQTQNGDVIAILHQYAYHGKGKTIHSSGQLEWYKNDVNDRSIKVGGLQRLQTIDGYTIPINICDGLAYATLRPYTDDEWNTLPHIILTGDVDWDPCILDHQMDENDDWYDAVSALTMNPNAVLFDEFGDYRREVGETEIFYDSQPTPDIDDIIEDCVTTPSGFYQVHERNTIPQPADFTALRPLFGWLPIKTIQDTFANTTQFARTARSTVMKKHYRSPFPALNVHRRNESVATDTVFSDTPAIDNGATCAQIFVGTSSLVTDVYGMKTESQFVHALEDNIRERGAMNKLLSDRAKSETSLKTKDILRAYAIADWQSEPHQQHQNPAERRYQTIKTTTNTLLDRTGSPASTWLLCLQYTCFLLNHTYNATIEKVPLHAATGSTVDISALLRFSWYQVVYYRIDESAFPSESREGRGRFVGVEENCGHAMTFKILTDDTQKVISRSGVRCANEPLAPNLRLDPIDEENTPQIVKSLKKDDNRESEIINENPTEDGQHTTNMPTFNPTDLIGRSFIADTQDGQRQRIKIIEAIDAHTSLLHKDPIHLKFRCSTDNEQFAEILSYAEILDYIEKEREYVETSEDGQTLWKFKRIVAHEGPLARNHANYKGSRYNVMVEWETGETTSEPLSIVAADDPVSCAVYARDNNLLLDPSWRRFKAIAKRHGKYLREINQAKLKSFRQAPKYQYGYEVPRSYNHAVDLDNAAGNTKWQDSVKLEMEQLAEYDTFTDHGMFDKSKPPDGYKRIRTHLVFAIKHDGRHKSRLVAGGHLTDTPIESVYSGVVSLRGLRLLLFLAELNGHETWATDIGNAYLEAETKEKVFVVAGPEFGELEGHTLIIFKALYGLKSSGLRWHERFSDCLRQEGFTACIAEPDIWMRRAGDVYEYIAVYVDDLAYAMSNPQEFADIMTKKYNFKLKGTGHISFHLGCDFARDDDGTLTMAPKKYIEKMVDTYQQTFGEKPKETVTSPLEKGDHPELDVSDLLGPEDVVKYQSFIGAMQWAISIGRFDIQTAVMTLSSFRASPRKGHLERAKRIYGYLAKMKNATIRFRVDEPDYSALPEQCYDWTSSVYGEVEELLPTNAPEPLGKFVQITHYVDANLYHCMLTGRSVTGILTLINKTPIDWYSKKQNTVETATYGSEFVAARTCTEQNIDLKNTLRYLGVNVRTKSYMFGDNESVVNSSTLPHAKLHKRHTALSFHRVREAIASGILSFYHIRSEDNPADILSKHWGYQQVWQLLQPILYWRGDTATLFDENVRTSNRGHQQNG
jgi:hypothetical protein